MIKSLGVLSLVLAVAVAIDVMVTPTRKTYEDRFLDFGVYRIRNRVIVGVLTFNQTSGNGKDLVSKAIPSTEELDDSNPGQKWRLETKMLTVAFELRPLLDDRYVLEYWNDQNALRWLASWGWGDNKMWYLQDAGDGFTLVRNKQNDVCLETQGIGQKVTASKCTGRVEQQWQFVFTSPAPTA